MRPGFQFTILLLLLTFQAWAAKDPITWSLNKSLVSPAIVGRSTSVTYTFTSQLPATMTKPMTVIKHPSPYSDFSFTDNCTGQFLAPGQSCTVTATLTPATPGAKSLQLQIGGYDNNILTIPTISTTATGNLLPSVYGKATQSFPNSATAGTSLNYRFRFTNTSSTPASNVSVNVTQTSGTPTFVTDCGSTLATSCSVSGSYLTTDTPSSQTVTAQLNYGSGNSTAVSTSTTVTAASSVVTASFVDSNYLPPLMIPGTYLIKVLFSVHSATPVTFISATTTVDPASTAAATFNKTSDSCTGQSLANANCEVDGTATITSTGTVTLDITANYNVSPNTTAITTTGSVVNSLGTSRTINVVNNCSFPVYFSLNGGAIPNSPSCNADTDCYPTPPGTAVASCDTSNHTCFFKNYVPGGAGSGGNAYKLDAAGGAVTSNSFTIPTNSLSTDQVWSGNISASLNCTPGSSCAVADCGNNGGNSGCQIGKGFSQPATQAEFTLLKNTSDSYDVEVINGFTLPISMAPIAPTQTVSNYTCGTPGDPVAENGFGSCNWSTAVLPSQKQVPPSTATYPGNGYYYVTGSLSGGEKACSILTGNQTDGSSCPAGTVCGMDSILINNIPTVEEVCGNFLGFWTGDQVCGLYNSSLTGSATVPAEVGSYFMCNQPVSTFVNSLGVSGTTNFPANSVLSDILICAVPKADTANPQYNSCYNSYSSTYTSADISTCCGCADWWTLGIGANTSSTSCTQPGQASPQTDPVWNNFIQYTLQWMKQACPSAYTYPFDDKTSGYSCTNNLVNQPNSTGYTITFCPGTLVPNNTGLPSGVTEGRTN